METLNVLRAVATQAGRRVRTWRTDGLPGRSQDALELVEHLAVAAAAAADTSLMEFQLLRAQISELRSRLDTLEGKNAGAAGDCSRGGAVVVLMLPQLSDRSVQVLSTPNA
jgi:hypothetical protein